MSFTDIFAAIQEGTVEDVRYFVEKKGADVNAKTENNGLTALGFAKKYGYTAMVQYLVGVGGV